MKIKTILDQIIFLLVIMAPVFSQEVELKEISYRFNHYKISYTLNENGESEIIHDKSVKLLDEKAQEYIKSHHISYSTSAENCQILEAFTLKQDGRKLKVPESNYQLEINSNLDSKLPPAFSDQTTLSLIFPELEVGDSVQIIYKITQKEQYFPKQFSEITSFPKSVAYDQILVTLNTPENLKIRYETSEFTEKSKQTKDGRTEIIWSFSNPKPVRSDLEAAAVVTFKDMPGYAISTFDSYQQIAEAYGVKANQKATVTPKIQTLADQLTKDANGVKEQTKVLYDWVSKNIKYAGNCIGVGAVVPRDLDFVLENKLGDCKDHATLLQALLSAKKIVSSQALINASGLMEHPDIPSVAAVNHVINYIPELNLFVDSTSSIHPFGTLPSNIRGRPVLLVDNFQAGLKTQLSPIDYSQQIVNSEIVIAEDGSAQGKIEVVVTGDFAIGVFEGLQKFTIDQEREMEENAFTYYGLDGSLDFNYKYPDNTPEKVKVTYEFNIKKLYSFGKTGAKAISPLFAYPHMQQIVSGALATKDFSRKFYCTSGSFEENYKISFPKTVKLIDIPTNTEVSNDYLVYQSKYENIDNQLIVKRVMKDLATIPVCEPAVAIGNKEIATQIKEDLEAQYIYK